MDFLKEPMDFKFFTDSGNLFHSRGPLHMIEKEENTFQIWLLTILRWALGNHIVYNKQEENIL